MSPPTPLPRIGITVGEPAGIGPEVISAALHAGAHGSAEIRVYGDSEALERAGGVPNAVALEPIATAKVEPGQPQAEAAHGVVDAIRRAAQDCLAGKLDGMVTGPISKELLGRAGYSYPGHTELLAELSGVSRGVMMLVGGRLRVALATLHCALREVPNQLTTAGLLEILSIMHADLTQRFALSHPRIAVCGLNPHAGEGGRFGDEEERIIQPAVEQAQGLGIDARGPLSADSLFHRAVEGEFQAVLGMYHDQALAPLKLHAFGRAVNVTLGLPLIRTSVDHGTAFDIAGTGQADPGSMMEAIGLCRKLCQNAR